METEIFSEIPILWLPNAQYTLKQNHWCLNLASCVRSKYLPSRIIGCFYWRIRIRETLFGKIHSPCLGSQPRIWEAHTIIRSSVRPLPSSGSCWFNVELVFVWYTLWGSWLEVFEWLGSTAQYDSFDVCSYYNLRVFGRSGATSTISSEPENFIRAWKAGLISFSECG